MREKNKHMVEKRWVIKSNIMTYPYDKWISKPHRFIRRGKDFNGPCTRIAQLIRNYVSRNKKGSVTIACRGRSVSITVWSLLPK